MKKEVLVTGATGAVGPALVRQLVDRGYAVRVLARRPPSPKTLPAAVQMHQADIADSHALKAAVDGVDVVYHLAAKLHISNPTPAMRGEFERVNVEGTRRLASAAQAAGVRRLVFFSTISVYGPSQPGHMLDENSPLHTDSPYAQTKREAEGIVLSARSEITGGPLGVVLRLAAVYGPGVKGNYYRLVAALRKGWFVSLGAGHNRRTLIYDQDAASAALVAAEHPSAAGQIYNVTDGQVYTFDQIVSAICEALDRPPPRLHLPASPVRFLVGGVEDTLRLIRIRSSISRSTVDKMLEDVAVSGNKIQRELGFRPQFDLNSGWTATISQMPSRGERD